MKKHAEKMEAGQMKIAELSRRSGVSVSTLYDYLKSGLLPSAEKESPTKAYFGQGHLERLSEIKVLKDSGLTLSEIRERFVSQSDVKGEGREPSDEVKLAIVDKALELFSRFHYENTKISDITDALNMGNGTFYRYFNSKEDLFLDCLERLPRVLVPRDAWAEVEKETDFILRLKKRGYAMLNAFPSYIGILNYAKLSLGKKNLTLSKKAAECIQSLVRPLKRDLEQAIREGHVRDVDAELCAYLLLGINETFGYLLLMDPQCSVEKGFAVIEDFLTHALARRHALDRGGVSAEITDVSGHVLTLAGLRFDNAEYLEGRFLEGQLKIRVADMDRLIFEAKEEAVSVRVMLKGKKEAVLTVAAGTQVSGVTPLGMYSVGVERLKTVQVLELVNRQGLG